MLSFRVIQAQHARRDLVSSPRPVCSCHPFSPNSHGIISFADHHLLNPVISYRYKNVRATGPQNSSLITRHCSQLLSYHSLAHYFASRKKVNPFIFSCFRTLCPKPPGVGTPKIPAEALRNCGAGGPDRSGPSVPLQTNAIGATIREGTGFLHDPKKQVRSPRCLRLVSGHRGPAPRRSRFTPIHSGLHVDRSGFRVCTYKP
jgi:hypothetical protein